MEAYKSDKLRRAILKHTKIVRVVDFGDFHIFKAGITTAIIILHKDLTSHTLVVHKLKSADVESELIAKCLMSGRRSDVFEEFKVNQNRLTSDSWNFAPESIRDLYEKIDDRHHRLDYFLI